MKNNLLLIFCMALYICLTWFYECYKHKKSARNPDAFKLVYGKYITVNYKIWFHPNSSGASP